MRAEVLSYLDLASHAALKGDIPGIRRSYYLGAVGLRSDGTIVTSYNGPTMAPNVRTHAEFRLCRKLDSGAVVYVARITRSGALAIAKPCPGCYRALKSRRVSKVYYSIAPDEFGCIVL